MFNYVLLAVIGVSIAVVSTVIGVIWFATEDPLDILPGGNDSHNGSPYEILNTYTISNRFFF
jgi:hypothetical protein